MPFEKISSSFENEWICKESFTANCLVKISIGITSKGWAKLSKSISSQASTKLEIKSCQSGNSWLISSLELNSSTWIIILIMAEIPN